jgi:inosose dehydratase
MGTSALLTGLAPLLRTAEAREKAVPHIATNTYPWLTFARRSERPFTLHTDQLLADIASTGITGYEPIITDPIEFDGLGKRLRKHGLEMRSLYVNSTLHAPGQAKQSVEGVLAIAKAACELGVKIVVTNPSPIRWGGPEDKNDAQLRFQAETLDGLGAELRKLGMVLAYHNHDAELRQGGREFHHMLTATDPSNVKFCLDAHWVFRGCGDSEVAVFDALMHYHDRVVELHLRQSIDGVWTEAFSMQGDIDYGRMFGILAEKGITPHLVLEQAVEAESRNELSAVEAHRQGRLNLMRALA